EAGSLRTETGVASSSGGLLLRLADAGDPEPGALVVLPPRGRYARLGVRDDVQFQQGAGGGEGLVEFENAVVGVEVVPDEMGVHTDPIGQGEENVSRNRPTASDTRYWWPLVDF